MEAYAALPARPRAESLATELRRAIVTPHTKGERADLVRKIITLSGNRPLAWRRIMDVQQKTGPLHKLDGIIPPMNTLPLAPHIAPAPPLPPSGQSLRARLAEIIETDLLRFAPDAPEIVAAIATVAADLAHLTKMFEPGCDPRIAPLLLAGIATLARGLALLGTARIAGSFAERMLIAAMAVERIALATMPAAGTA